jgi:hypothetical protein
VIDLAIVKTTWLSLFENGDMLFAPVANVCKRLTQVNGSVGIMPDPEQKAPVHQARRLGRPDYSARAEGRWGEE